MAFFVAHFAGCGRMCNATGYHHNNIEGTAGKIIPDTKSEVNELGIYKADVEVNGVKKNQKIKLFPGQYEFSRSC